MRPSKYLVLNNHRPFVNIAICESGDEGESGSSKDHQEFPFKK